MDPLTIVIVIFLLILSGLFSGLTLGLMSLDKFSLRRKAMIGNKYAKKIYPLRKKGNQLLCTLLLGNVAVNSILSIFLGSLTSGLIAIIVATSLIVLFGEILPQAIYAKHALKLGAQTIWVVYIFFVVLYPITRPLAAILDSMLGSELPSTYSKKEFRMLLQEHKRARKSDIDPHEFRIMEAGLVFSEKHVKDVMTPKSHTFFIEQEILLTKRMLTKIQKHGHSRMPVHDKHHDKVVGLLYAKDLIQIDPKKKFPVKKIMRKQVQFIRKEDNLDDVLSLFKKKGIHLFVVLDKKGKVTGIITLEDVLEEIVGEIVDEYDLIHDLTPHHA